MLLVEDESLIAMWAEDMLLDLGCEVVLAMRFDRALNHARTERFDSAVLDVDLGDAHIYPTFCGSGACRSCSPLDISRRGSIRLTKLCRCSRSPISRRRWARCSAVS